MKILVIVPITDHKFNEKVQKEVDSVKAPDCDITLVNIEKGTPFIESRYAEYVDTAEIIRLSLDGVEKKFDGIFIDCFGEPGVSVVRELVDIPVVGGFEPAVVTACMISRKFSVVTVVQSVVPMVRSLARDLGVIDNLASVRTVDIPVEGLSNVELLKFKLLEQSEKAIRKDGAESIVLGCTGMLSVARYLEKELKELKLPAPVVDPTTAAIGLLQSFIRSGISQSRLTYSKQMPLSRTAQSGTAQKV